MELKRGITGIQGRKDPSPIPPFSDLKAFRSHCHLAARTVGAKLLCVPDPSETAQTCSYITANFEFSDSAVAVLLNVIHPIVAFARCPVEGQFVFKYIDCPRLAEVFLTLGEYTVAAARN